MLNQLLISSVFLTAILSFLLGGFSFIRNPKSLVIKLWTLFAFVVGMTNLSFWFLLISKTSGEALFYSKFLHFWLPLISIFFLHFVLSFTYPIIKPKKVLVDLGYILAILFSIIALSTNLLVKGISSKAGFTLLPDTGTLYPLLLIYYIIAAVFAFTYLTKAFLNSDGVLKKKFFWVLVGILVLFITSSSGHVAEALGVFPYGYLLAWIYPIFITYGVFMDDFKFRFKS